MNPNQFRRARDLFEQALERDPAEVAAWLGREVGSDDEVQKEVLSLLKHHSGAGSFLAAPVSDRVPGLFVDEEMLEAGAVVGSYTIVHELGRGGMGRVYLATDGRLGRTVALKALAPRLIGDPSHRERLRREARAAALLTHPGICTVYALEEIDGALFIASEFIDGQTLREEMESGRRPSASDVIGTARELCAALAAAHAKGITHRDLKPENVMRGADGRLKILDFGLARLDDLSLKPMAAGVTQPGTLIGTPAYMAPEQLNGQQADARTDVFALGVVLYEYACGAHPFNAPTPLALAARVLESDVRPVESLRPDLGLAIANAIERSLRKLPAERFPSAGDMLVALARESPGGRARTVWTWWRTHQLVAIALYFIACVVGWQIKELRLPFSTAVFVFLGIAASIGGVFRGHLVFTQHMNRVSLQGETGRARPVLLVVDLMIACALAVDGFSLARSEPLMAVLTFALAVGIALARLVLEPATTEAAFDRH